MEQKVNYACKFQDPSKKLFWLVLHLAGHAGNCNVKYIWDQHPNRMKHIEIYSIQYCTYNRQTKMDNRLKRNKYIQNYYNYLLQLY